MKKLCATKTNLRYQNRWRYRTPARAHAGSHRIDLFSLELWGRTLSPPLFPNGPANQSQDGPSCDGHRSAGHVTAAAAACLGKAGFETRARSGLVAWVVIFILSESAAASRQCQATRRESRDCRMPTPLPTAERAP